MAGSQIPTSVTRLESMLGYQAVSLTEFDTSALSSIAAGSKVEIAGAFFTFSVDEAIEASTWTAITTGNTAYIALVPAGTAGSQTVTARFTATAPVWSMSKQGWYATAASSTRVIGSVYKAEATIQHTKYLYPSVQANVLHGITPRNIIFEIATTESYIFAQMNQSIPLIGQKMLLTGMLERDSDGSMLVASHAIKSSSTRIIIYTYAISSTTLNGEFIDDGGAATYTLSLAW